MVKIFLSVRNRLAITKKCIKAIKKHSLLPHRLYVFDNGTTYKLKEHFEYFCRLYEKDLVTQVTFSTEKATFNAFSKAATCNFFGLQHEQDPKKDDYFFLVLLDNDIIVTPGWDEILKQAWKDVERYGLNNIKVVGQLPAGIKDKTTLPQKIAGRVAKTGKLGGSGLWSVRNNFFRDVGFLDLRSLIGEVKKHDQQYWSLLNRASRGQDYILGINEKLGIHCGFIAGSVCNVLNRNRNAKSARELIKFEKQEERIEEMTFEDFLKLIKDNVQCLADW